jgi:hypothetical protein
MPGEWQAYIDSRKMCFKLHVSTGWDFLLFFFFFLVVVVVLISNLGDR